MALSTFDCKQYERLYGFMQHDKKNNAGVINFTLLKEIGDISINQTTDKDTISKCSTSIGSAWVCKNEHRDRGYPLPIMNK